MQRSKTYRATAESFDLRVAYNTQTALRLQVSDADADPLTAILDTTVSHGGLTLNANGGFSYTPTTGYSGPDSFTYHANDGTATRSLLGLTGQAECTPDLHRASGAFDRLAGARSARGRQDPAQAMA